MKKIKRNILILVFMIIIMTNNVFAQIPDTISPYWVHTRRVVISHEYIYGNALCLVDIKGLSDVDSIQNVDIVYSVDIDGEWVEVASWKDLSAVGNSFRFETTVPNVELSYTYRLSFTADVHRNGTIEWLNQHYEYTY